MADYWWGRYNTRLKIKCYIKYYHPSNNVYRSSANPVTVIGLNDNIIVFLMTLKK